MNSDLYLKYVLNVYPYNLNYITKNRKKRFQNKKNQDYYLTNYAKSSIRGGIIQLNIFKTLRIRAKNQE